MRLKNLLNFIFVVGLLALTAGCANWTPWYQQNYAGITHWTLGLCEEDQTKLCTAEVWDGKEKTDVNVTMTRFTDGQVEFSYSADGVQNAEVIKARAAVDVQQGEQAKEVTGEIVKGAVKALTEP